ncbi:MAG: acyltransferase [Chitinispirillales bacterium]|jgi:peptidoglycan/LPS O-acetylase OafA/YrhL|nr:acyltransferase [Chitinispirillales bacterium]
MHNDNHNQKALYFSGLDGLRLIASVNIVLFHFQYIGGFYNMGGNPGWFFRILKGPAFHASLFFILGGFIFATKFAPKIATFKNWPFLKKRFSELYPLHLITTLIMASLFVIKRWGTESIDWSKLGYSIFMHLSFLWSLWPFGSLNLNTPSWALSAMFFCYLLFGPLLRWTVSIKNKRTVIFYIALFFVPIAAWAYLYGILGPSTEYYHFFHTFAPVRFFEFGLGVLLAKLFILRKEKTPAAVSNLTSNKKYCLKGLCCDLAIVFCVFLVFQNLGLQYMGKPTLTFFSYHVLMVPIYLLILYIVAIEKGITARILSFHFLRKMGRTSFYPYMIHIPLMSIVTMYCERVLGYRKFLHSPRNIVIFMIVLYGCSYLYVYALRDKRRAKKMELEAVQTVQTAGATN